MSSLRIASDRSSEPLPPAPPPPEPTSDPLAAPAHPTARTQAPAPPAAPPARPPAEPAAVSGPRKIVATARHIAELLEREPALWPGLTACVTDTDGLMIVHYTVLIPGGTESTAPAADPDPDADTGGGPAPETVHIPGPVAGAVPARWRMLLAGVRESHRVQGREHVTVLRGVYAGLPVTVLFTVLACG